MSTMLRNSRENRRIVVLLMSLLLLAVACSARADDMENVKVQVQYGQTEARNMLALWTGSS